ncbi:MAG: prefoldin subunit alpha [Thaumarchaeota archaeon]|nr:prefoldin subunit alpha [Nitrososphaerota archaeon]
MSEEQAQALMQQLQALEGYLSDVMQREESVMRLLQEASSAIESIKSIGVDATSDTLVPVGMGAYLKAKIEPNQKVIVHVGAGTSIEQDRDSAINYVESRMKELEIVLQQLAAQRQEVSLRLEQGQQEMNKLIQSARGSTQ